MLGKEEKEAMRKEFLEMRGKITLQDRETQNCAIRNHLISFLKEREVEALLVYVSFRSEVETFSIIDDAFRAGIKIAAPRCKHEGRIMHFFQIESIDDLESGYHGILEPSTRLRDVYVGNENTACIVPGAAFDRSGFRIGYGAGFYDRYLADYPGITIGLAFDCQLSDLVLPHEDHDKKLDYLATSNGLIKF